jgi:hypothetical protein
MKTMLGIGESPSPKPAPTAKLELPAAIEEPPPPSAPELDASWAKDFVTDDDATGVSMDDPTLIMPSKSEPKQAIKAEDDLMVVPPDPLMRTGHNPAAIALMKEWDKARKQRAATSPKGLRAVEPTPTTVTGSEAELLAAQSNAPAAAQTAPAARPAAAVPGPAALPPDLDLLPPRRKQGPLIAVLVLAIVLAIGVMVWAFTAQSPAVAPVVPPPPLVEAEPVKTAEPAPTIDPAPRPEPEPEPEPTAPPDAGATAAEEPADAAVAKAVAEPPPRRGVVRPKKKAEPPPPPPPPPPASRDFNGAAAKAALAKAAASVSYCPRGKNDPRGSATASVTFANSGRVSTARVGAPFAGKPIGACIQSRLRQASVPPFDGNPKTLSTRVTVP